MNAVQLARKAVSGVLARVRELAHHALDDGQFDSLEQLASIARQLEVIVGPLATAALGERTGSTGVDSTLPVPAGPRRSAARPGARKSGKSLAKPAKPKARSSRKAEATYYRRGTDLVKVGIAKAGGTYEHKAPRAVREALVVQIDRLFNSRSPIRMDQLMEGLDEIAGQDVPSYQAYLCLAWLRTEGLVIQHGRRGYTLSRSRQLGSVPGERFDLLPSKN